MKTATGHTCLAGGALRPEHPSTAASRSGAGVQIASVSPASHGPGAGALLPTLQGLENSWRCSAGLPPGCLDAGLCAQEAMCCDVPCRAILYCAVPSSRAMPCHAVPLSPAEHRGWDMTAGRPGQHWGAGALLFCLVTLTAAFLPFCCLYN